MAQKIRSRTIRLVLFTIVALIYLGLSTSLLVDDALSKLIGERYLGLLVFISILMITLTSGAFLANLYSFAVFRQVRHFLLSVTALLLTIIYLLQLYSFLDPKLLLTGLSSEAHGDIILILTLSLLTLLLIKLVFVRNNVQTALPLKNIIVLCLGIVVLLVGLSFFISMTRTINDSIVMIVMMTLVFFNLVGYIIKYFVDGDEYAKLVLFIGIIHLATYMYPMYGQEATKSQIILVNAFRLLSLIYLVHGFFRKLFSSYMEEVNEMNRQKDEYTNNLEQLVDQRTRSLMEANKTLNNEINAAKELQQSMMPAKEITYKGASFVCENIACERMSGDFFDIYEIDEDNVGMYILDVSGHGINAALMNVYCYNYIRSTSPLVKRYMGTKPSRNLNHLYREFNKMGFPDEMHIVILIASYNMKKGILTYSNGGLNVAPILVRKNGDISELNESDGFPICKMGDLFTPEYTDVQVQLYNGDRILFCTDGLLDDRQGFRLESEDIKEIMLNNIDLPLKSVDDEISKRIEPFRTGLVDDVSYFVMQVES